MRLKSVSAQENECVCKERIFADEFRPQRRFFVPHHHPLKSPFCLPKSLPNMTDLEYFSEILSLTSQIRTMLPPLPRISQTAPRTIRFLPLNLECPSQQALSRELSSYGVNVFYHEALIKLFLGHLNELHRGCEAQYERLFEIWQQENLYEETYDQAFRHLLNRLFSIRSRKMWYMLLKEASKYTQRGSSPPGPHDDIASHEGAPLKTGRGHDSEAVRILEQAFKHSPNITPAEKFRLSEVTGLKPKQVTIWVSA